ncbi:OmpW/AlkL family protein [Comamonas composti]|uniref:OmpW/AlkL family protein n=1 Tax=Comamonas composti TaxID=408558 RepID=UPI00041410FD|nr:OmpW family outer membrane protein [Comamonas composti]
MKALWQTSLGVAALAACTLVSAQSAGSWSGRVGATRIDPQTSSGRLSAPSFRDTRVDVEAANQVSGGISYMVTDNWALDLPLALPFKHDFVGDGAIAGVGKLGQTKVLPMTLFAEYRFGEANARFRPYLGLGITYAWFSKERTTAAMNGLTGGTLANPTTASIDNKWGITPKIGLIYSINERWFVDAAFYKSYLKTTTHLSTGQSINIKLNPNVYAISVGYRF